MLAAKLMSCLFHSHYFFEVIHLYIPCCHFKKHRIQRSIQTVCTCYGLIPVSSAPVLKEKSLNMSHSKPFSRYFFFWWKNQIPLLLFLFASDTSKWFQEQHFPPTAISNCCLEMLNCWQPALAFLSLTTNCDVLLFFFLLLVLIHLSYLSALWVALSHFFLLTSLPFFVRLRLHKT